LPSQAADMLDRRTALSGACLLAITAGVSGCSGRNEASTPAPGTTLASTAEIPVDAGSVFAEHRVVVTQPAKGTFRAFSAVCTHQGCIVQEVSDGTINCPCHGSRFDIADGSVVRGPAQQPLPRLPVTVEGTGITLV
jgi:nitrite reductase/ring-hydroxylating ferredoxin subunit